MRKNITSFGLRLLVFFLLSLQLLHAQNLGDFRSKSSGNWTTPGIWEVCTTAGTWAGATTATQYPGETSGSYAVTIDHTIELTSTLIRMSNPMGTVTINGSLNLNGDNSPGGVDFYIDTNVLIVTPPNATINFINKVNLILNVGIELQVSTGGLTGDCSHNQTIKIGTKTYSYCVGGKPTFENIMDAGGINTAGTLSGNQNICMGTTTPFTSTVSGGAWSSDQLSIATVVKNSGTVTGIAVGTATIKYTTLSGKISTRVINVNPNLTAGVTINGPSNVVCAGTPTPLTFTATPTNGGTTPGYQWKVNGGNVGTNSPSFTSSSLNVGDLVRVVLTSNATPCLISALPVTSTNTITITTQTAIYTGNWDVAPTANLSAEIRSAFSSGITDWNFCSLKVTNNAPVNINTGGSFTVQNGVTVESGSLTVASDANLIQVNNSVNTGNITANRVIKVGAARSQYNYLGTPVNFASGETFKTIYPGATYVLYHNEANNMFYNSSGVNIPGRGLAVKEPTGSGATTVTATYKGVPQNGNIALPLVNSNTALTTFGYNLVGNPYPSNIDLRKLYNINGGKTGTPSPASPNISATFYFWDNTGNTIVTQQGSGYLGQSYAIYNALSDTGTKAGSGSKVPTKTVKVGQGFMTRSLLASYNLNFNNSVRITAASAVDFFGKGKSMVQDDRYWLKMTAPSGITSTIAIVHFPGGNNLFGAEDSRSMGSSDVIYSIAEDEKLAIDGRSSLVNTDIIPLGTQYFAKGNYVIGIDSAEGIFANGQSIYLKDKQTDIITNLSQGTYTFAANAGESTGRFEIIYQPETVLSTDSTVKETFLIYRNGSEFVVRSSGQNITDLQLFDASGRLILQRKGSQKELRFPAQQLSEGMFVVKATLKSGEILTRKIRK